MDSGLHALALVARLRQLAVDSAQLQHRFALPDQACSVDHIVGAAKSIGFRAQSIRCGESELNARTLPAIAQENSGAFFVIASMTESVATTRRYLIQRASSAKAEDVSIDQLQGLWSGLLILLLPKERPFNEAVRKFNLRWFLPSIVKYRKLFIEVVIASFFLQLFALVTPLFFQVVMDKVLVHKGYTTLDVLAVGFVVVVTFEAIIGGLRNFLFSHTTSRVDVELGSRLFHRLSSLPLAYFEVRQVGQTVARVRELDTIRNFITGTALTLLIDLSFTFVFFSVLWYYSPTLTFIVLGALPFYIGIATSITPTLKQRVDQKFRDGAASQAFLTETVSGMSTVKAQALEPQMQRSWEDKLARYVSSSFLAQNLNNVSTQVAALIGKITTLLIIWWGAHLVIQGALSVGQLVAFNMIAGRVTAPILKLVQLWQEFQQAGISIERLGDILNTPGEPGFSCNRSTPKKLQGNLSFQGLSFRYSPSAPLVIQALDLDIKAGQIIGIVGRSGSGKSTLAKLVQRLYVPESGRMLLDGIDAAMLDTSWVRQNIGVVQQESFLFNRTVRDNIALSCPTASFERVVQCARVAGAHEFILELEQGYDTMIGEQGSNLSGGQRQRIAIARAIITDPRILILDEATSALDYESERLIQENMGAISVGRTVIIVAHRLSTVRHCDKIVVLNEGGIVESGTHEELIALDAYYARLHGFQSHSPPIRSLSSLDNSRVTVSQ